MKRLERYSTTKKQEIGLVLKIMNFLKILDKMDKNSLGWEQITMEIINGFGRFTVGEEVEVEILDTWYTKNQKLCMRMKNNNGEIFSNNILDKYKNMKGRCLLTCTGVNGDFPYIELKKLQDSSWDIHDEVKEQVINPAEKELIDWLTAKYESLCKEAEYYKKILESMGGL